MTCKGHEVAPILRTPSAEYKSTRETNFLVCQKDRPYRKEKEIKDDGVEERTSKVILIIPEIPLGS